MENVVLKNFHSHNFLPPGKTPQPFFSSPELATKNQAAGFHLLPDFNAQKMETHPNTLSSLLFFLTFELVDH